jgi:hypothetical protein
LPKTNQSTKQTRFQPFSHLKICFLLYSSQFHFLALITFIVVTAKRANEPYFKKGKTGLKREKQWSIQMSVQKLHL